MPTPIIDLKTARIVEDLSGLLWAVADKPYTDAAYTGVRVKRAGGGFEPVAKARIQLVRIVGTSTVREG